jgi:hypothetical protein
MARSIGGHADDLETGASRLDNDVKASRPQVFKLNRWAIVLGAMAHRIT